MRYAYRTEEIEIPGFTFRVEWCADDDHGAPWDEDDCHGGVVKRRYRSDKKPGERRMGGRHNHHDYYYDWQGTMQRAIKDGWSTREMRDNPLRPDGKPWTRGQIAEAAVQKDFERLSGWLADDWHYCGIVVTLCVWNDDEWEETGVHHSLWGLESDADDYHQEVIRDLVRQCLCEYGESVST